MILAVGAVLIAALVARQSTSHEVRRRLVLVAGTALGIRLAAVTAIYLISIRTHGEGTWLSDEASFWLAAESLLPNPLDTPLPQGLGHLGGNAYLGLLTATATVLGHMDSVAFRLTNAILGTLVALLTSIVAAPLVGRRGALAAGLVVAVWPTLVLWSATFLRDTLGSFVVLALWWTLVQQRRFSRPRVLGAVTLALMLLTALRPYLAGAVGTGVFAWAVAPWLGRRSRRSLLLGATALVVLGVAVGIQQSRRIDQAAHELVYRQLTTRLETLGLLNYEVNPHAAPIQQPFGPGAAVALVDQHSGWLLTGLVREPIGPGEVAASFIDGSIRNERISDLVLLQSAPLTPVQLLDDLRPGLLSFLTGASGGGDSSSLAWVADAVAGDVLIALAVAGGLRARVPLREWVFPACVVLGTVGALVGVPGAPGNDDRHRATQTVPLLVVFAAGLLVAKAPRTWSGAGLPVSSATSSPASAATEATSRTRSLR
ncbi:MAG: hypothetical protein M3069_05755 [Chloroflexota bacterium]|nr:hypothetical protein [Chloroflexota bacterium]